MDSTVWDQIYKDYQKGGPAWATLDGGLDPHFKDFIEKTNFTKKKAFDIGYGTGQYLQYLKRKSFLVAGIDSSPTAYKIAAKAVGKPGLVVGNMYDYDFLQAEFDLILSISTIHHGTKTQIKALLDKIFKALAPGGYAYITLPIHDSSNEWMTFKDKDKLEPGTYAPNSGPEKGLPHSFYSKQAAEKLFDHYKGISIDSSKGRWLIAAQKDAG